MAHVAPISMFSHQEARTEPIPQRAKVLYVVIVTVILAIIVGFVVVRGVLSTVDNSANPVQPNTNTISPGVTNNTGAPTNTSDTPSDRVTPSPAGSGGNTLLNPQQS